MAIACLLLIHLLITILGRHCSSAAYSWVGGGGAVSLIATSARICYQINFSPFARLSSSSFRDIKFLLEQPFEVFGNLIHLLLLLFSLSLFLSSLV